MSDFTDLSYAVPERLTAFDSRIGGSIDGNPTSTLVGVNANQAIYLPIFLPWTYPIKRFFWVTGASVGGNVDVGVYSIGGVRLASVGGVSEGASNSCVFGSAAVTLSPGRYFLAFAASNGNYWTGANQSLSAPFGRLWGYFMQNTAYPLPATATFAAWSGPGQLPLFGFSRSASGV